MKQLCQGAVPTSAETVYTVPSGFKTLVTDICLSNTTTGSVTCTVYLVPSAGSADATNQFLPGVSIGANTVLQWTGGQVITAGETVKVVASAAGVAMRISGDESRD